MEKTLEDVIRQYVNFEGNPAPNGFEPTYCEKCGDGSRTQGPRGGFKFDGDTVGYNCFNCGAKGSYDPDRDFPFTKLFPEILEAFGIPKKDYMPFRFKADREKISSPVQRNKKKITFGKIEIPEYFKRLQSDDNSEFSQICKNHLLEKRGMSPEDYPFYVVDPKYKPKQHLEKIKLRQLVGRLIIPGFKNGEMYFYESRNMFDSGKKYITEGKKNVALYNIDALFSDFDLPLIVTEGFFDSYHYNGTATLTNQLSEEQEELLSRSRRPKIVVPDRYTDHNRLAMKAIDNGWYVSLPEFGGETDLCSATVKYGKVLMAREIQKNVRKGQAVKLALKMWNMKKI